MSCQKAAMPEYPSYTPFPAVNRVLNELLEQTRTALDRQFYAMYLTGSLALGDFDPASSDIDYVVVTSSELSTAAITRLRRLHECFDAGNSEWAKKIEAVYVPPAALSLSTLPEARFPQVEKGTSLFVEQLEPGWSIHCATIRNYGVTIAGPDPRTLIDPVDPDVMRRASMGIAEEWYALSQGDQDWLDWMKSAQPFVVLTLCRLLYTLVTGGVASKPAAALWAEASLPSRWAEVIKRARDQSASSRDSAEYDIQWTRSFIAFTVEQFRQWSGPVWR